MFVLRRNPNGNPRSRRRTIYDTPRNNAVIETVDRTISVPSEPDHKGQGVRLLPTLTKKTTPHGDPLDQDIYRGKLVRRSLRPNP